MSWVTVRCIVKPVSCAIAILAFAIGSAQAQSSDSEPNGRASLAMIRLEAPGELIVAGLPLDKDMLHAFYAYRNYALAWDGADGGLSDRAATVYATLTTAESEGLEPADYHVREIARLADASTDADRLNRDLLLTDGLVHYASDVSAGKLTSRQTDERYEDRESLGLPQYLAASANLDPHELSLFLANLAPATPQYIAVKAMLAQARRYADAGGWSALPDGGSVHPGMHDPIVPMLRQRLIAEGWLPEGVKQAGVKPASRGNDDLYDQTLSGAVAAFQAEHAIKADGVIGKDTRAALDLPAQARVQQLVVNLERLRWGEVPSEGRAVEVNLASYSLKVFQDGTPVLTMPVVVGSRENPTPMIASRITTVVLNPNWTLPPNVIKEMLPRIRDDDDYLRSKGIAREESDGHVRLVQPPGPTNPLGRYKFVMPNDKDIYLHDSPDVAKFHYALRAYSHGCIRLGNPAALAALLLDDRVAKLPEGGLDALVQTGETRHIALSKPVPVSLVYRTAWLDQNGKLVIGEDSYGRDVRLWKALHKAKTPNNRKVAERTASAG
jgi:murein L,D-transpeptidase YcbB/YkuD